MSIYLTPAERFEINAAIERVMNDEDQFPASAGRFLIKAVPITPKPSFFQMRGKYKSPGSSVEGATTTGANATTTTGEEKKTVSIGRDGSLLVGGWRINHERGAIEFRHMWHSDVKEDKICRLSYNALTGEPDRLELSHPLSVTFGPLIITYGVRWDTWKLPAINC